MRQVIQPANRMHKNRGIALDPDKVDIRSAACQLKKELPLSHSDLNLERMVIFKKIRPAAAKLQQIGFADYVWTLCQLLPRRRDVSKSHVCFLLKISVYRFIHYLRPAADCQVPDRSAPPDSTGQIRVNDNYCGGFSFPL